jgi:hypothetical protein
MRCHPRPVGSLGVILALLGPGPLAASGQGPAAPRPGLSAEQTQQAATIARKLMEELRLAEPEVSEPQPDRRAYVVGVELWRPKEGTGNGARQGEQGGAAEPVPSPPEPAPDASTPHAGPLAIVTCYRYHDDTTVFATIDVGSGRVVRVETAVHLRTPLSREEFEEAQQLALEQSEPVQRLYQQHGPRLTVYPQFSQLAVKGDPRLHRVVHLTYRLGNRDLSYPRPIIDLTTREVTTPAPPEPPRPRPPR